MHIDIRNIPVKYINMDKDVDRNSSMQSIKDDLGLTKYTRVSALSVEGFPKIGCAASHHAVLKDAKESIIILEDDCAVSSHTTTFEVPDDADAVYLGLSSWGFRNEVFAAGNYLRSKVKDYDNVYKVDGMLATHAILYISKEYIELANRVAVWAFETDNHIDRGLASVHKYFNIYALGRPIFYQNSADNRKSTNIMWQV